MIERETDPVVGVVRSVIVMDSGRGTKELTLHRMFLGPDIYLSF